MGCSGTLETMPACDPSRSGPLIAQENAEEFLAKVAERGLDSILGRYPLEMTYLLERDQTPIGYGAFLIEPGTDDAGEMIYRGKDFTYRHDEGVLLDNVNNNDFKHSSHTGRGTCITCHDPHGSASAKHLLNFETRNNLAPAGDSPIITGAGAYARPTFIETANGGECWLRCHSGTDHLGAKYPPDPMIPPDLIPPPGSTDPLEPIN